MAARSRISFGFAQDRLYDAVGNRLSQIACISVGNCVTTNYILRLRSG
jgi:hypothetical protein